MGNVIVVCLLKEQAKAINHWMKYLCLTDGTKSYLRAANLKIQKWKKDVFSFGECFLYVLDGRLHRIYCYIWRKCLERHHECLSSESVHGVKDATELHREVNFTQANNIQLEVVVISNCIINENIRNTSVQLYIFPWKIISIINNVQH